MNVEETIAIIEALKLAGAVSFKSRDFEVSLRRGKLVKREPNAPARKYTPVARDTTPPIEADVPFNPVDTKKAEDLIDILKRRDEQIMDLVFPEGA